MTDQPTPQPQPAQYGGATYSYGPLPTPPKGPNFFQRHWLYLVVGVVALALGSGIGAARVPEPVTVTKEVPGPERQVFKEVAVPTTPKGCLNYIDLSEQVISISGEAMGFMSDGMFAAAELNNAGVLSASGKLKPLTERLNTMAPSVQAAKAECRNSAK